jgi:hypothetical protein
MTHEFGVLGARLAEYRLREVEAHDAAGTDGRRDVARDRPWSVPDVEHRKRRCQLRTQESTVAVEGPASHERRRTGSAARCVPGRHRDPPGYERLK